MTMETTQQQAVRPIEVRLHEAPANEYGSASWVATPVWPGVDRPDCYAIHLGPGKRGRALAERYRTAALAGAVFADTEVLIDVNGKTFMGYRSQVLGRHANADLKRLGF